MKITVAQGQLLKSLQMVEHAVNDRSALPVLANVLLETKAQELILTATDLDVGVRCRLTLAEEPEQGAVTIPARRLTTIIRELPPEPVLLEAKSNHTATLVCGASRFRIPGLPAEDFPVFPSVEKGPSATLPQASLKELITRTAFAMSLEETRFILNGTLVRLQDNALTLAATDGRRLAVAQAPTTDSQAGPVSVVIPAKTVRELSRLLQDEETDPVTIALLKDNQLQFEFGSVTIITRLLEGQFPPYDNVVPAKSSTTVTVSRALFAGAVRRASLMTTATSEAVVFELSKDKLVVSKESAEFGSAREELAASYAGPAMTVAFNPAFWLDALKVLDTEDLTIELALPPGADTPATPDRAVIRLPQFLYLAMAMKSA